MNLRRSLFVFVCLTIACVDFSARAGSSNMAVNVIYSFTNGLSPNAGVVMDARDNFYGTTATGGPGNLGGIYEVTSNGVLANMIWFANVPAGAVPEAPLIQDASGNFYGTTSGGGVSNNGTVFELTSGGQFVVLASFNSTNGANPVAPLLEGTNGWFYGTTPNGGSDNLGTIFQVNSSGVLSNIFSFSGGNGGFPNAGLVQGNDGNLYGSTPYGGANGLGTIFRLTYSNTFSTMASFAVQTGAFPGGLIQDSFSNFYGATINGGTNFAGTIFRFIPFGPFAGLQTLLTFDINNGANPNSPLTLGQDGFLYGTTQEGGAFGGGTTFRLDRQGLVENIASFDFTNGAVPRAGMVQAPNGNFYGTTSQGGAYGAGEIYELSGFPPVIISEPLGLRWSTNGTAHFVVVASGSPPLSYQWVFDGTNNIPGASNASFTVNHEQLTNSGTYTVIVSSPYGSITSSIATLSIAAPTVVVVPPAATVTNASLVLSGTAEGPAGIAEVLYQLNSNGWLTASGTTHWQANLTLQPGTNIFQVQSFDPIGNPSAIKTVSTFYATVSPITLETNGIGSIVTSFKGTNLIVDRTYTVHAIPGKGHLFLSWTGTEPATENPLTFVMQSNMVLQANFVTNPFIATAATYAGLFLNPGDIGQQSSGLLSSLVLETPGAYSGTLVVKGIHYGFSGAFALANLKSSPTIARANSQGGPLTLSMTLGSNEIMGTVTGTDEGGWTSPLLAERLTLSSGSSEYTLLIPPSTSAPAASPPGYGYMLITNHSGHVTLNGATADGGTFSQIVSTVGAGDVPFYASLYDNTGVLIGWLNVADGLTASNLWWVKTSSAKTALYTNGFTNLIANAMTSTWTKPAAAYLTDGTLTISNENLDLNFTVSITNITLLKETGSPTNSLTGVFNPRTGLLQITFGNGGGRATTLGYCAVLGDSTNGGGYFLTKTNGGVITLTP